MKFIVEPINFNTELNNSKDNYLPNCSPYEPITCGNTRLCWSYCGAECYRHTCTTYNKNTPESI